MPETQRTLNAMAEEVFELYQLIATFRSRQPAGPDELSETEYVTLDVLSKERPITIGEVQKRVGVVPAQMSRIVRALEEQGGRGYVECKINPHDRRCIDVYLTKAGREAYDRYRSVRLKSMHEVLAVLPPDDRIHFMRILEQIRVAFTSKLAIK